MSYLVFVPRLVLVGHFFAQCVSNEPQKKNTAFSLSALIVITTDDIIKKGEVQSINKALLTARDKSHL